MTSTHADDNSSIECIAEWNFGTKEDLRRDGWPDSWTRQVGRDFPNFIPIAIHQNARSPGELIEVENFRRFASQCQVAWNQGKWPWQVIPEKVPPAIDQFLERTLLNPYLRAQMDGGSVEILSRPVPADIDSIYSMNSLIRANSPDYEAGAKLRFLDNKSKILFEKSTKAITGTTAWKMASTNSLYPFRDDVAFVQVVLQVKPRNRNAFRGEFGFDSIRILRTPRISLFVDKKLPYYQYGEEVIVRCTASGMSSDQSKLELFLTDHTGEAVAKTSKILVPTNPLEPKLVSKKDPQSPVKTFAKKHWDGSCEWRISDLEPGYYEITTQLDRGNSGFFELDKQFVVLADQKQRVPDNRFGWTMSTRIDDEIIETNTESLLEILRAGFVGKVKLPIWFDNEDKVESKLQIERIDKVLRAGVGCVGVIAVPPASIRSKFPRLNPNDTATALEDSLLVQSYLEPVMRQICMRISEIQIGWDHEPDFVLNPRLKSSLDTIKGFAKKYGQEPQFIASRSTGFTPVNSPVVDRWQLFSSQPLTVEEMNTFDANKDPKESTKMTSWKNITPISANQYSLPVRTRDLVSRMLQMLGGNGSMATSAWISNPFDTDVGLLAPDGGPREMFLPFRNTSAASAGMRKIGSLSIPALGENYVIASSDIAKLIAWSTHPTTAQLFLGDNVSAQDVWGRPVAVDVVENSNGTEQRISIGSWPIIIEGIDIRVARWRMGISLEESRIDPLVGQTQTMKVLFANPFPKQVVGQAKIIAPSFLAEDSLINFEIEENFNGVLNFPIQVKADANTMAASIKLEFAIQGERPVVFVVDQDVQVGTKDFEFAIRYEIDSDDQLKLFIEASNNLPEPASFDCVLQIPGRPRERFQIAGLRDKITKTIVLDKASDLTQKALWLRCDQVSTSRILNYRVEINP